MSEVKQIGNYETESTWNNPQTGRGYSADGISPTLNTCNGEDRQPKIIIDDTQGFDGNRIYEDTAPTLRSQRSGLKVLEPTVKIKQATQQGYAECKLGGVADLSYPTNKTRRGRVQDNGDTCPTLAATETGICRIETPYRIRKLTPKECWRLMDFTDEDFHKAEAVNSNTQLYKQAGNSIVKAVLIAIFKQMM